MEIRKSVKSVYSARKACTCCSLCGNFLDRQVASKQTDKPILSHFPGWNYVGWAFIPRSPPCACLMTKFRSTCIKLQRYDLRTHYLQLLSCGNISPIPERTPWGPCPVYKDLISFIGIMISPFITLLQATSHATPILTFILQCYQVYCAGTAKRKLLEAIKILNFVLFHILFDSPSVAPHVTSFPAAPRIVQKAAVTPKLKHV